MLGALVNYFLNHKLTFRSVRSHREAMTKFFVVAFSGMLMNAAIMWIGVDVLSIHYFLVQMFSTGCMLVLSFSINRAWTF